MSLNFKPETEVVVTIHAVIEDTYTDPEAREHLVIRWEEPGVAGRPARRRLLDAVPSVGTVEFREVKP